MPWTGPPPDRARFTVSGFGGQGISYAAVHFADRSFAPDRVMRQSGRIVHPQAVLKTTRLFAASDRLTPLAP